MLFDCGPTHLFHKSAWYNRAVLDAAANHSGVAALMQADPKKQGKEKKPDANRVSLVFPGY